jgi:hypothetical protein
MRTPRWAEVGDTGISRGTPTSRLWEWVAFCLTLIAASCSDHEAVSAKPKLPDPTESVARRHALGRLNERVSAGDVPESRVEVRELFDEELLAELELHAQEEPEPLAVRARIVDLRPLADSWQSF